jgi:hypothetical protein
MKNRTPPPATLAMTISDTLNKAFAQAGLDPRSGPLKGVTDTIRKALVSDGARHHRPAHGNRRGRVHGPHAPPPRRCA